MVEAVSILEPARPAQDEGKKACDEQVMDCFRPPITGALRNNLLDYPKEDVVDGCTATAHVAYACSDAAFLFPITPSSSMAEAYEAWSAQGRKNIFGKACAAKPLQSEAGAAGSVHGSLSVGALSTTFTASQGLLLMIPPMYKIAGELIPAVFHVAARAIATQALSIFGDHSDVMAIRQCGWALLSSASVQEAQDLAMIAHMATLKASVPFVHFFDGFRTSHELQKISILNYNQIRDMIDFDLVHSFRQRALNPMKPYVKGTAQGPEVYFQNVEVANKYYDRVPAIVEEAMATFAKHVGRSYELFRYYGAEDAEIVLVIMGAGGPVVEEVIDKLAEQGEKVGLITVKLFRPWKLERFAAKIPKTCKRMCVLDRSKENGALGEPLYVDVAASLQACKLNDVSVINGRYGLGSKDFTPAMVMAVIKNTRSSSPTSPFVVGIDDDLTNLSLDYKIFKIDTVPLGTTECMFWGMGSDGTVGANKNVIKIIGSNTPLKVQGYFAYSAHKAGGITVSHLRFGPSEIRSQYLLQTANYVAVHRMQYIAKYDVGQYLKEGGTFVLNTHWTPAELETEIPAKLKRHIAAKKASFYVVDANKVAADNGMGRRINNVLMTSFFKLSGVLPFEEAITLFKKAIQQTYGKKGQHVVDANWKCVDAAAAATSLYEYDAAAWASAVDELEAADPNRNTTLAVPQVPDFVHGVMLALERMEGDSLPTSSFEPFAGGVLPPGTAGFEKRAIALNVPVVDMDKCTQCNHCAFVCPHAAIRPFLIDDDEAERAPADFVMKKCKAPQALQAFQYRIQVSPYDCTGCQLCAIACPDEALTMTALEAAEKIEEPNWNFAINLKDRTELVPADQRMTLKGSQFCTPMIEFSGACEACGETPYIKLLTQLFGERLIIANATGCSTIYAATYPANAYTVNQKGYGPAWANSLYEDNAEFGYGMAVATAHRRDQLRDTVQEALSDESCTNVMSVQLRSHLSEWLLNWLDAATCQRVFEATEDLLEKEQHAHGYIRSINQEKTLLPRISQWLIGGDGWAYDIGFGGLDHVIASGVDVNFLVLDTQCYSNTGGQQSKATTAGAVAKFASGGRYRHAKDLGSLCMVYEDVYVATCASSANMSQTVRAFVEAEAYNGPSVIIAYSPCIEHQYIKPFSLQLEHCKLAVDSGFWPLYRYNPALMSKGENPFQLDSKKIKADIVSLMRKENRFGILRRQNPKLAAELEINLRDWATQRVKNLQIRAAGFAGGAPLASGDAVDWNVVYGTDTGNTEEVAKRVSAMLRDRGLSSALRPLDDFSLEDMAAMKNVVLLCSTCGQGALPEMAHALWHEMEEEKDTKVLANVNFACMGLGDSSYVFYNSAAIGFDKKMEELGAKRILPCGLGDDQAEEGYETGLGEWMGNFVIEAKLPEEKNVSDQPPEPLTTIVRLGECETLSCKPDSVSVHQGGCLVTMVENRRMTPEDYDVDIRHVEYDLGNTGFKYARGDSMAMFPTNGEAEVMDFCRYYGFNPHQIVEIKSANEKVKLEPKLEALLAERMTIYQLFSEVLDLFAKPNRAFYQNFYKYVTDPEEKKVAKSLLADKETLTKMTREDYVHYFDVFKRFPSSKVNVTLENLIGLVPVIKVRYYSIASAQKYVGANKLQLCIGVVDFTTKSGEKRLGRCTGYVARAHNVLPLKVCAMLKPTAFNLPPNDMAPIIVAGMGTGLAPFRAFIQHKAYLKRSGKNVGPMTVYFGCRYKAKDYLYSEELEAFEKEGVIDDLKCAFSRDQKEKFYIQHAIKADPALLYKRLVTEDGYFYLCGSAKQVPIDIRAAVRSVLCTEGGMTDAAAEELITQWQIKGKYNLEAWS